VSPIPSPVLILRNSGPTLRLATTCHGSNAGTGEVSACRQRGRPTSAPCPACRSCRGECAAGARRRRWRRLRRAGRPAPSSGERRRSRSSTPSRRRRAVWSQIASNWRSIGSVSAAAFWVGCARGCAACPAADFGCRDAPGSTAGRCPPQPSVPPGLDAGVHEAEHRVDLVMVEKQALAVTWDQLPAFGFRVAHDLIRRQGSTAVRMQISPCSIPSTRAISRAIRSLLVAPEA
jgi:hypothetical protein